MEKLKWANIVFLKRVHLEVFVFFFFRFVNIPKMGKTDKTHLSRRRPYSLTAVEGSTSLQSNAATVDASHRARQLQDRAYRHKSLAAVRAIATKIATAAWAIYFGDLRDGSDRCRRAPFLSEEGCDLKERPWLNRS